MANNSEIKREMSCCIHNTILSFVKTFHSSGIMESGEIVYEG